MVRKCRIGTQIRNAELARNFNFGKECVAQALKSIGVMRRFATPTFSDEEWAELVKNLRAELGSLCEDREKVSTKPN